MNHTDIRETMSENSKVEIRKAIPIDFEFAFSLENTLSEWFSENDEEAYSDLSCATKNLIQNSDFCCPQGV